MKKFLISLVAVSLLLALVLVPGCAKRGVTEVAYGSTSAASGTYAWYVAVAGVVNKNVPECHLTVIETAAAVENTHLIYRGDLDMGLSTNNVAARGYHGIDEFKGEANPDLRTLWCYLHIPHTIFVTQESGVKSIYELEGKKFGCGMTGSATEALTLRFFDACGIHPDWFRGGTAANRDATKNRQIIGFVKSGAPSTAVMDVASVIPIRLLPLADADFVKAEKKYPGMFVKAYAPANAYGKGVPPTDTLTYLVVGIDVATSKLPKDLGYKMAKCVYENKETLIEAYKITGPTISRFPESTIELATVPLHAGVVQLCKEQGVEVPAKLVPPECK